MNARDLSIYVPDPNSKVITTIYDPRLKQAGEWYAARQNSTMSQEMRKVVIGLGQYLRPQVDRLKVNVKFDGNQLFPDERESICAWCQKPISQCEGCEPKEKPQRFSYVEFMRDWERDRTMHFDERIMTPRGNYDTQEMLESRLIMSVFHDAVLHCGQRLGFSLAHETIIHQMTMTFPFVQDPLAKLYLTNGVYLPVVASAFSNKRTPGLTKYVDEPCPFLPENFYE